MHKFPKRIAYRIQIFIMIQMIFFHVSNYGHPWQQIQKRAITLIRFSNQNIAFSAFGIAADLINFAANNYSRIQACQFHHQSNHRGGSCFPMGTGYTDCPFIFHQMCQHFRAMQHRNTKLFCTHQLRIVLPDSAGTHNDINLFTNIFCFLSNINYSAFFLQPVCYIGCFYIRTGNPIPVIQQNFCNPAHTDTADPHKIDMFSFYFLHNNPSSHYWQ